MHSSQNEWPQTAVRHEMIKSMQIVHYNVVSSTPASCSMMRWGLVVVTSWHESLEFDLTLRLLADCSGLGASGEFNSVFENKRLNIYNN